LRKKIGPDYVTTSVNYPLETRKRIGNPHLFYGILNDTKRIIQDYDAREDDIDWLIEKLIRYKESLTRKRDDGS